MKYINKILFSFSHRKWSSSPYLHFLLADDEFYAFMSCVLFADLHVCSVEWMDHPCVPVPRTPPSVLELPHCQVIITPSTLSLLTEAFDLRWLTTGSNLALTHVVKWSDIYLCFFPWCTALRGWRIQWSIVPEVSEPVVRNHFLSCPPYFNTIDSDCIWLSGTSGVWDNVQVIDRYLCFPGAS